MINVTSIVKNYVCLKIILHTIIHVDTYIDSDPIHKVHISEINRNTLYLLYIQVIL